jgi:hypothetical protein
VSGPACRRCGHARDGHLHYAQGGRASYCGHCGCWQYRQPWPWTQFLAWMRRPAPPVTAGVLHPRPVPLPDPGTADGYEERTRLDIRIARPYTDSDTPRETR